MNIEMPRSENRERQPEQYSWEKLSSPLTLGFADESGAVLADESGKKLWYFDVNDMTYRTLLETDLSEHRQNMNQQYPLKEGAAYENGALAAMNIRKTHLEEQLKVLAAMKRGQGKDAAVETMMEGIEEELGYVRAYLADEDPKERAMLIKELNEMYEDMRAEEVTAAAAK